MVTAQRAARFDVISANDAIRERRYIARNVTEEEAREIAARHLNPATTRRFAWIGARPVTGGETIELLRGEA